MISQLKAWWRKSLHDLLPYIYPSTSTLADYVNVRALTHDLGITPNDLQPNETLTIRLMLIIQSPPNNWCQGSATLDDLTQDLSEILAAELQMMRAEEPIASKGALHNALVHTPYLP